MNVTVAVTTVLLGLVLTYQALTFVSVLLVTSSTLIADNVLVKFNIIMLMLYQHRYSA